MDRRTLAAAAFAALLAAPFCFDAVADTDTGWHLALGQRVFTDGIAYRNLLTWTVPDYPWYATSWLWDVFAYGAVRAAGVFGIQLLTFVSVAATLTLLAVACRRTGPLGPWVVPAVALLLAKRITERPHVATWAVLAAVLALCMADSRRARLWALPVLVLGSNLHSGAVFPAIVLALFCAEAWWRERKAADLGIAAAGFATIVMNPGGLFNAWYLFSNLGVRYQIDIVEMRSPTPWGQPTFYVLFAAALVVAILARKRNPVLVPLVLVFGALGVYAMRLVYEFEIVSALAFAEGLEMLRERVPRRAPLVAAAAIVLVFATRPTIYDDTWPSARWDERRLPVRAADYVLSAGLSGHGYNNYSDGGYLEWALPFPAFADGRLQAFPPEFLKKACDEAPHPESFDRLARGLGVEWAVVSRLVTKGCDAAPTVVPGWAIVHWDSAHAVIVRRDVPKWQDVVARDEYRCVKPGGSVLGAVAEATTREAVARCVDEADRFEKTTPDHPLVAAVRCGALTRLGASGASSACALAELLGGGSTQALLAQARSLPPVP